MRIKSQKGSITIFVLIALLFYMGFLLLLYASNVNRVQTISEGLNLIKSIYNKNVGNIEEVYNRVLASRDNTEPIIKEFPTKLITNVTELEETYEEYGQTGGVSEYIAFNNKFSSLKEVLEYAGQNNLYGETNIVVNAYGNNGLLTTQSKDIEIIRGMKVTNESELNTAIATTDSLYISVANNIECSNIISVDNVNHTLDLNNHTISCTKGNETYKFITLGSNTQLTILDSSTEKNGAIIANMVEETESDGDNRTRQVFCIMNSGKLTLESGRIAVNIVQKLLANNDGASVNDLGVGIESDGVVNINGGNISVNVETQACTYLAWKFSTATSVGIHNMDNGTLNINEGLIQSIATAGMVRPRWATVHGATYAYAYGICNTGVMNNEENMRYELSATAKEEGTTGDYNEAIEQEITSDMYSTANENV